MKPKIVCMHSSRIRWCGLVPNIEVNQIVHEIYRNCIVKLKEDPDLYNVRVTSQFCKVIILTKYLYNITNTNFLCTFEDNVANDIRNGDDGGQRSVTYRREHQWCWFRFWWWPKINVYIVAQYHARLLLISSSQIRSTSVTRLDVEYGYVDCVWRKPDSPIKLFSTIRNFKTLWTWW